MSEIFFRQVYLLNRPQKGITLKTKKLEFKQRRLQILFCFWQKTYFDDFVIITGYLK